MRMSRGLTSLRAEVARRARSLRAFAAEVRRRILGGRARVTTAARKGPLRLTVLPPGRSATVPPDADYVYAPVVAEQALDPIALGNAALCLTHRGYDFILFSRSLAELPRITAPREVRQSVVFVRNQSHGTTVAR